MSLKKIEAGALQLTTFIVVVIALLLATFIILLHTHKTFKAQTGFLIETVANSDRGMNYALKNRLALSDTTVFDLQDGSYSSLKVHRDFWGIFERISVVSNIKNKTFKKMALIGGTQPEMNRIALYLEDQNRPLVVVGNTKIEGDVYLPKQGVRAGNISGHSYYGNQLIYGNTKISQSLPKLQEETLHQIKHIPNVYKSTDAHQFLDLDDLSRNISQNFRSRLSGQNSFYDPMQIVFKKAPIYLSNVALSGHILVQSETEITVDASSTLKDVVLVAPNIVLKNNVEGTFQAFATKGITVGNHCKLEYPSALVLEENPKSNVKVRQTRPKETPIIKINKDSDIRGVVAYLGTTKDYHAQVFIDEKATIMGEVHCNRNIELLGTVYGTVFTAGFVASQSGSVYQNHIYNGEISVKELAEEFVGLLFERTKKGIAKWLY